MQNWKDKFLKNLDSDISLCCDTMAIWDKWNIDPGGTCQNLGRDDRPIFFYFNLVKSFFSVLAYLLAISLEFTKFPLFF